MKLLSLIISCLFVFTGEHAEAPETTSEHEIRIKMVWEKNGYPLSNACGISADEEGRNTACTNEGGVAVLKIKEATKAYPIYIRGIKATCAKGGETVLIKVKACEKGRFCPVRMIDGRCEDL
jgi:hypothetical protein